MADLIVGKVPRNSVTVEEKGLIAHPTPKQEKVVEEMKEQEKDVEDMKQQEKEVQHLKKQYQKVKEQNVEVHLWKTFSTRAKYGFPFFVLYSVMIILWFFFV